MEPENPCLPCLEIIVRCMSFLTPFPDKPILSPYCVLSRVTGCGVRIIAPSVTLKSETIWSLLIGVISVLDKVESTK